MLLCDIFSSHLFHFYDIGLPLIILINDFSHTLQHIVIQLVTVLLSFTRSHKNIRYIILFQQRLHMCFICRSINILDICDLGINVSKVSSPQPLMHIPSHDRRETGHGRYTFIFGITVAVCFKHHFYIFDIFFEPLDSADIFREISLKKGSCIQSFIFRRFPYFTEPGMYTVSEITTGPYKENQSDHCQGFEYLILSYDQQTKAKDLVATGDEIAAEFGIPVVNKRVSVTPIALVGGVACHSTEDFVSVAKTLDKAAKTIGVNFIGGYSALVSKGMTPAEDLLIRSIPQALAVTERVCSSVNVGSTKTGINMDAVKLMGEIVLETAEASKEQDSLGCAKLVVFCNAPDDNPFMAGAFHGVTEADCIINVGVSGPGVVKTALESVRGADFQTLCEMIKRTAFKVTRVGQLVAQEASKRLGVPFGIVDLSLAPTPAIGDSVAEILEEIGLERVGAPGTTAALALLNDQVKKGGVMAAQAVGGLSGAFIPVSEDQGMIDSVNLGALTLEKLEAMTCVCSVGLDMIAIPGDTKASTIAGIIADESAIGMINQKTTAVRLIPVIGKGVGETVEFGGLLGYAPIMPVNQFSCNAFVERGGRIPAPIHSFKN